MRTKPFTRLLYPLTASLLLAALLSACSLAGGGKKDPINLTVVYWDSDSFERQFGSSWNETHPNITVKVVSMPSTQTADDADEAMDRLLNQYNPDVVLLSRQKYRELAAEGKLTDLAAYMAKDSYKLDDWYSSIERQLRSDGDGIMYGLAPSFYSKALFYNRELFQQAGVPEPTDGMTWEETFALAERIAQSSPRLYGLYEPLAAVGQPYSLFAAIGQSKGLADIQPASHSVPIDSPAWVTVADMLRDAVQSRALYAGGSEQDDNLFLQGKAAMGLYGNYLLDEINSKPALKDTIGIVTAPVDGSHADATPLATVGPIYAIQSSSEHPQEAWQLVRHIADTTMKGGPKLIGSGLPAVMPGSDNGGIALEPFYKLQVLETSQSRDSLPKLFADFFNPIANETLLNIMNGQVQADEGLQTLSTKGQTLLKDPDK